MMLFFITTLLLLSSTFVKALPYGEQNLETPKGLNWAPCDLDFPENTTKLIIEPIECATLDVPLDYTDLVSDETLGLTLVKVNATKEPFKGSVIFNPGGPGISGIEEVATKGPMYREIFGGQFNVIGFDVRGVGRTIPFACDKSKGANSTAKSNSTSSDIQSHRNDEIVPPQLDMWEVLHSKAWDDGKWFANACYESNKDIGRFLSTAFVARDMLRIVDALNEDGKLRFWGRSYSTDLGQTFAAMFPDRIDRMLLDSVHRSSDYMSGNWLTASRGTGKAILNFFRECVVAGSEACPIANFTGPDTTAQSLMDELSKALQELIDNPVYLDETYQNYVDWWRPGGLPLLLEIKYRLLQYSYRPDQFPYLLGVAATALNRDWASWTTPLNISTPTPETWSQGVNAFHGIACSDATFRAGAIKEMYSTVQSQAAEGSFADAFQPQSWVCAHWRFQPAERYEGHFKDINTSYPIMFASGLHDPITPLSAAWEAASGWPGSRLLVHKGHGHGVMNHPSSCTIKAIGEYFANGTLPEHGTECEPDMKAFEYLEQITAAAEGNGTVETRDLKSDILDTVYTMAKRQSGNDDMARFGASL